MSRSATSPSAQPCRTSHKPADCPAKGVAGIIPRNGLAECVDLQSPVAKASERWRQPALSTVSDGHQSGHSESPHLSRSTASDLAAIPPKRDRLSKFLPVTEKVNGDQTRQKKNMTEARGMTGNGDATADSRSPQETVLVTGGSGFLGSWTVVELLRRKYSVRTTIRDLTRAPQVRAMIATEVDPGDRLRFVQADLLKDRGWEGNRRRGFCPARRFADAGGRVPWAGCHHTGP
jgi:hypothetical protein